MKTMTLEEIRDGIDGVAETLNTSLLDRYIIAIEAMINQPSDESENAK